MNFKKQASSCQVKRLFTKFVASKRLFGVSRDRAFSKLPLLESGQFLIEGDEQERPRH